MFPSSVRPPAHVGVPGHFVSGGLYLPHESHSAGVARGWVREVISGWLSPDAVQDALLLTTELVANAILHGAPDVYLHSRLDEGERLRVQVFDTSPLMPRLRGAAAGGGRGLTIVDETAERWGVLPGADGGKAVWFELLG